MLSMVLCKPANRPGGASLIISLLARLSVGGYFVVFAWLKIAANPDEFVKAVRGYELMPVALTNAMGYTLPWVELAAGLLLVLGVWRREAAAIVGGLLIMFIAALLSAIARGLEIDCGCAASGSSSNLPQVVARNVGLLCLLGVDAYFWHRAAKSPPPAEPADPAVATDPA